MRRSKQEMNIIFQKRKKYPWKDLSIHIYETEKITHSPMAILVIRIIYEIPVLYDFSMRCVRNDVRSRCIWIRTVTIIHVHACEDIESINKHAIALLIIDEC